MLGLSFL